MALASLEGAVAARERGSVGDDSQSGMADVRPSGGSRAEDKGAIEAMKQISSTEKLTDEHISIHGHRIGYRRGGQGPVLLLLHGIAGSSLTWVPAMSLLQTDYTVLAPDFPGHGASEKPLGDYSLGNLASAMRDFLNLLGIDRATVVGQSFGGGVALQFAYQFPERCERLVLVDAGGLGREVNWILRLATLPGAEYVMPALFPAFVQSWGDSVIKFFGGRGFRNDEAVEMWRSYKSLTEGESRRRLRSYHTVRDRPGRAVGERRRPPLSGRAHADAHRLGRPRQDHSAPPCPPSARGHPQQQVGGDGGGGPLPPRGGARPLRRDPEGLPAYHGAQQVRAGGAARLAAPGPAEREGAYEHHIC